MNEKDFRTHKQETGRAFFFYKDGILTGLLAILRKGKCKHSHYSGSINKKYSAKKDTGLYFLPIINKIEKPFSTIYVLEGHEKCDMAKENNN